MAKDWDKENMRTLGVHMKKDKAIRFQEYAKEHGTTVGALLRGFIDATLAGGIPLTEGDPVPTLTGWTHIISFKNEDLLKSEVARHNPEGLNPDDMLNRIVADYFRLAKYLRR